MDALFLKKPRREFIDVVLGRRSKCVGESVAAGAELSSTLRSCVMLLEGVMVPPPTLPRDCDRFKPSE